MLLFMGINQKANLRPIDSIWEGGCFRLRMEFSEDYPVKPPIVVFLTKMFHPNSKRKEAYN